jgi:hypothetical protein
LDRDGADGDADLRRRPTGSRGGQRADRAAGVGQERPKIEAGQERPKIEVGHRGDNSDLDENSRGEEAAAAAGRGGGEPGRAAAAATRGEERNLAL